MRDGLNWWPILCASKGWGRDDRSADGPRRSRDPRDPIIRPRPIAPRWMGPARWMGHPPDLWIVAGNGNEDLFLR